ncbi:armadillo repeat-containing protein 3 isoform X1 [Stigmatopora nigra]
MDKKDKKEKKSKCVTPCNTFEPLHVDVKTAATAVLLLGSLEEDIIVIACEALFEFAEEDGNKVYLMELGTLQPLCQLITHHNELVRRNAFMVLGTMASNSVVGNVLQQKDLIQPIIEKLALDDSVIQEYGTLCLSYLSLAHNCKVQIFDNKGMPALIKLLSSPEPDVQKNSLETIYNLIQNSQFCPSIVEFGGIPSLLELLKSDFSVIQLLALRILQKVTAERESHSIIRKEQALEKIIDVIKNPEFNDLHVDALQVIANCIGDSDNFVVIENAGGLTILLEMVLPHELSEPDKYETQAVTCNYHEVQCGAVECISIAAQNADNHKVLHGLKVEEILIELLSGNSDCVKTFVCQALAGMSSYASSKELIGEVGGLTALICSLGSQNMMVKEEAIQAIANLTAGHKQNSMIIYEEGGHDILTQRLGDGCPKIVANAAALLCRIMVQEEIRCDIISVGALPALVEPLKSTDSQVLINATTCICELALNACARAELQKAGGLEPLVSLLRSTHTEVIRSTCMAISVCAKDEAISMEMCKYGALEMLNEINHADNSNSKFSEYALENILQSSLSLKYAMTDNLAATDIITDGFYDSGKLCFKDKVFTLAELSMEPMNQEVPIIVVGAGIEVILQTKSVDEGQHTERFWKVMNDVDLRFLVKEVKESIAILNEEQEQYVALARRVSSVMGGAIEKEDLHSFGWLLHICLLRSKMQCNVVPIGVINKGFYCHRALLFKYLADCIGLRCTLVRGEYNRAWNEVLLSKEDPASNGLSSQPCCYIVDLMHQPGRFLKSHSPAAFRYHSI